MVDTQLDRIEKMLKIMIEATTIISLSGTEQDAKDLREDVKQYAKK